MSPPGAALPIPCVPSARSTTPERHTTAPTPPVLEVATLRLLLAAALPHQPSTSTAAETTPPLIRIAKATRLHILSGVPPLPPRSYPHPLLATRWIWPPTRWSSCPPIHRPAHSSRHSRWLLQGPEGRQRCRPQ